MTRNIKEFVNHNVSPRSVHAEFATDHVCILLAHYNGAELLPEQLESIARQGHRDWSLIISDDGSTDNWLEVASRFANTGAPERTWVVGGPQKGYAQNFLSLARVAGPSVPYVAFCDQDDVWMEDKLARALSKLKDFPAGKPALYCSRTMICDQNLNGQRPSPNFKLAPSFENALVQNIAGGNTMILNRGALDLLQDTLKHAIGVVSHDWWIYQIVSGAGGTVIFDETPSLFYRQHECNIVGANDTLWGSATRLFKVFSGRYKTWNAANTAALIRARHWLTPEARNTLAWFCAARERALLQRLVALRRSGVYRQTRRGSVALWLATFLKRL